MKGLMKEKKTETETKKGERKRGCEVSFCFRLRGKGNRIAYAQKHI